MWFYQQELRSNHQKVGLQLGFNQTNIIYIYVWGLELFGDDFLFPFCFFFRISCSVHFPCYLQHFGAGRCHFNGICSIFWVQTSHFPWNLQHFGATCSILELEAAMSAVFAAILSLNLSFSIEFATFWCSNCSFRVSLGCLLGLAFGSFKRWF